MLRRMDLQPTCRIGVISDTHGRLDAAVFQLFQGAGHIIHAGDIGAHWILADLARVAPVTAVRGNVDRDPWAWDLPAQAELEVCGTRILVGHVREDLLRTNSPKAEGFGVVIMGHSHKPAISSHDDVLYLNPGSAGPRRFVLPRACALLTIAGGVPSAEIVILEEAPRWTTSGEAAMTAPGDRWQDWVPVLRRAMLDEYANAPAPSEVHGEDHIDRVWRRAHRLGDELHADLLVLAAAVFLHDLGRHHVPDDAHGVVSAELAGPLLERMAFPEPQACCGLARHRHA